MRRRERNDEFDAADAPPKPQLPTWDGQNPRPEWYIEVFQYSGEWHARLVRNGAEVDSARWCDNEVDAVAAMTRSYENLVNRDRTRTFYVLPNPNGEDKA